MDRTAARPSSAWSRLRRSWRKHLASASAPRRLRRAYTDLTDALGSEFAVLLESPKEDITDVAGRADS